MKLSFKAKRNIGLVAITIAVIVTVFLIIFFVNRCEKNKIEKSSHIGEICTTDNLEYKVFNNIKKTEFESLLANEGKCFLLIGIQVKAKKDITIKSSDFKVDDGQFVNASSDEYDILNSQRQLKSGEETKFYLLCEVENDRIESYFIHGYGYKIDLGGTVSIIK